MRGGPQCIHPGGSGMRGLRGRGLGSSLGLLAMETSADPAGGYSGPTQEFIKSLQASGAGHWDSHSPKHLSGHRIKLSLYSFLPCPGLSPTHPQLAPCQKGAMPSGGARSSGHSPGSGGGGRAAQGVSPRPGHGHRASELT